MNCSYETYDWNNNSHNQAIQFQDELYCFHKEQLYQYDKPTGDWNTLPLQGVPEPLTISGGGIYIGTPEAAVWVPGGSTETWEWKGIGAEMEAVADGDFAMGDGTRELFYDASAGTLILDGGFQGDFQVGEYVSSETTGIAEIVEVTEATEIEIVDERVDDIENRWHVICDTEESPENSGIYLYPYVGTPVEPISNECICQMQTRMAHGCKCGGE